MIFHKFRARSLASSRIPSWRVLGVAIGLMLVGGCLGGCGGDKTDSATNVPGPPAGPQPGAAGTGNRTGNSIQ